MSAGWKYPWLPREDVVSTPCGGVRGLHTHSQHIHTGPNATAFSVPGLHCLQDTEALKAEHTCSEKKVVFPFFLKISYVIVKYDFFHTQVLLQSWSVSRETTDTTFLLYINRMDSFFPYLLNTHRCNCHLGWLRCFLRETISALFQPGYNKLSNCKESA